MFIFSVGGASLTILRNRFTEGALSYSIWTTQRIHDVEQCRAQIGNFNGWVHYAVIKLKLNLFDIMTSVS